MEHNHKQPWNLDAKMIRPQGLKEEELFDAGLSEDDQRTTSNASLDETSCQLPVLRTPI